MSLRKLLFLSVAITGALYSTAQTFTTYDQSTFPSLSSNVIGKIDVDKNGIVYLEAIYDGVAKFDGTNLSIVSDFSGAWIEEIKIAPNNNLWVGNSDGLFELDATGKVINHYDTSNSGLPGMTVSTFDFENDGTIWVTSEIKTFTYADPVSFDGKDWILHDELTGNAKGDEITGYAFDGDVVWMGCDCGVLKYQNKTYDSYFAAHTGLWGTDGMALDASGVMWFVGNWGVLNNANGKWNFKEYEDIHASLKGAYTSSMQLDGQYIWIGTTNGLFKYNTKSQKVEIWTSENSDLPSSVINDIALGKNGEIWLATNEGLVRMDNGTSGVKESKRQTPITLYPNPANDVIHAFINSVNLETIESVKVYNLQGKQVETVADIQGRHITIELGNSIAKGSYIIQIQTPKGLQTRKFLKS